jgi:hypothetical protein
VLCRLDHEIAFLELVEMLVVIGRFDVVGAIPDGQRSRGEPFQIVDCPLGDAAWIALLGRQIEEQSGHIGIGQMCGDLRAHDAGAKHGDLPNL